MSKLKFVGNFFLSAFLWEGLKLIWKKIRFFIYKKTTKQLNPSSSSSSSQVIDPEVINSNNRRTDSNEQNRPSLLGRFLELSSLFLFLFSPLGYITFFVMAGALIFDTFIAIIRFLVKSFNK